MTLSNPLNRTNSTRDYAAEPLALALNDDISSRISHEIRTPLTSIQGLLRLLEMGKLGWLSDEGKYLLNIALNNVTRLNRLANAIDHASVSSMTILSMAEIEQLQLENEVLHALQNQDFQVYYQPIIAVETKQVIGFEALARWLHPQKGFIPPHNFIPLIEKAGFIHRLGLWVLEQACQQLAIWQRQFPSNPVLTMSVNLSTLQLLQLDLVSQVQQILKETAIAPNSLKLEITESTLIENYEEAIAVLSELKTLGIEFYIDDFGTGYSSLDRLQDLPVDALKIDRSFVHNKKWDISETIIRLALRLGLNVIAEGVETSEEMVSLKALGCEQMQGYLFSRPVDSHTASLLMKEPMLL